MKSAVLLATDLPMIHEKLRKRMLLFSKVSNGQLYKYLRYSLNLVNEWDCFKRSALGQHINRIVSDNYTKIAIQN